MKRKKYKLSAIVIYSVIIALALVLPNVSFALQWGDFTYTITYTESGAASTITITGYSCPGAVGVGAPHRGCCVDELRTPC